MIDFNARVHALSMDLPSRDVGSRGEELASETIADELYKLGLQTYIDGFTCPGNLRISRSIYLVLVVIAALLCMFAPGLRVLGLVLSLVGAVMLYLSYGKVDPLGSLLSKYESQNVIARYVPQGASSSPRRGKIVITAHYDVKKPSLFQMPMLRKRYGIVRKVLICSVLVVPLCCLLCLLPLPDVVKTVLSVIGLIAGVVALLQIIDQIVGVLFKTPKGANNNASGLAVMMELARKIVTAEVRVPDEDEQGMGQVDWGATYDDQQDMGQESPAQGQDFEQPAAGMTDEYGNPVQPSGFAAVAAAAAALEAQQEMPAEWPAYDPALDGQEQPQVAPEPEPQPEPAQQIPAFVAEQSDAGNVPGAPAVAVEAPEPDVAPADQDQQPVVAAEPQAQEQPQPAEPQQPQAEEPKDQQPAQPARPAGPEPRQAFPAGGRYSQYPDVAPAPQRKSKTPSWWAKVEEEKNRGEIGTQREELTLRSRFADAPAYLETDRRSRQAEQEQVDAVEPVDAQAEALVDQPDVQPADQAAPAEPQQAAQAAQQSVDQAVPQVDAPQAIDPDATIYDTTPHMPIEKLMALESLSSIPEVQAAPQSADDASQASLFQASDAQLNDSASRVSGVRFSPEPQRPHPYEEPLVQPQSQPDWPTGSYRYSRAHNRYSSDEAPEQSYDGIASDMRTDMMDYSRMNYPYGDNREQAPDAAAADAQAQADEQLQAEEASVARTRYGADERRARREARRLEEQQAQQDGSDAAQSGVQSDPNATGSYDSLLNLPMVGNTASDVSIGGGAWQKGLEAVEDEDAEFMTRDDVRGVTSGNLTGSFAPLEATGTIQPVTTETLEQYNDGGTLYVEDAADMDFDQYSDEGSYVGTVDVEMPKKRRFGRRHKSSRKERKAKRNEELSSPSEWLGVNEDYNATQEGARIGSWDDFDEDDDWDGGAYGGSSAERNRDAIATLSDELLNKEVWFVALGASGSSSFGMRNLLKARASELRHSRIINLESIGAGDLFFTASETSLVSKKRTDPRLQKLVTKAARQAHVDVQPIKLESRSTEAGTALQQHAHAITIIAQENGVTPGYMWSDDTDQIVDAQNLKAVYKLLIEIIKAC